MHSVLARGWTEYLMLTDHEQPELARNTCKSITNRLSHPITSNWNCSDNNPAPKPSSLVHGARDLKSWNYKITNKEHFAARTKIGYWNLYESTTQHTQQKISSSLNLAASRYLFLRYINLYIISKIGRRNLCKIVMGRVNNTSLNVSIRLLCHLNPNQLSLCIMFSRADTVHPSPRDGESSDAQ